METLGRYRLLKRLASGGMGEVYLATQTGAQGFQKFVALKRVAASAASDPELISLFLDEARLVATLSHRAIVQVYDLGQDEAGFFVAMEFVQGPSVRALLDRLASQGQRLPPAIALDIAAQVGDALACAYYSRAPDGTPLRIIHRDVSPRNVLVSISGDVKLIDFGIAQSMRQIGSSGLTGKLAYMSPEQLRNEPLNARSDLFSLGIVLCEMLGGQNPFARNDPKEMVVAIQREEPVLPSSRDPLLAHCDGVLKRLLAKLPSERFADGIELAEALAELRAHFPKPPKRLSAIVSDLFGLEIAELLRVATHGPSAAKTEPAARPPPGLATPLKPGIKDKDAGLGTDSSPAHESTPSIYHRVTQPYLKLTNEREETQPNLPVPKIVRSERVGEAAPAPSPESPAAPEAEQTRPEAVPSPQPVEADSGDVVALREVSTPMPGLRTSLEPPSGPLPIDLPELKELQGQPPPGGTATDGATSTEPPTPTASPVAAEQQPTPPENELPPGAVPVAEGAPDDEHSWYKVSIPPGKAPPEGAKPTTPPPGQFDESSWFLVSMPLKSRPASAAAPAAQPLPPTRPAVKAPTPEEAAELAAEAQTTLPSTPDALVRARAVAAAILPSTSTETTMPGALSGRNLSLLGLAAFAGIIGVGIGLYIVRSGPAPVVVRASPTAPQPSPTPPTPVPSPTPAATPAPKEAPAAPEPMPGEAPPAAREPRTEPVFNINPKDMLAPLAPTSPPPAVLRPADRNIAAEVKAKMEEKKKPEKDAAKPVAAATSAPAPEIVPPPPPPPPDNAYQLIAESPFGAAVKVVSGSGSLKLGESEGMVVTLAFVTTAESFKATLDCQPWSIAAVNGLSVGKTPINLDLKEAPTKIELRRPGANTVSLQLAARKPH